MTKHQPAFSVEAQSRIEEIRKNPAFWDKSLKGHARLVRELLELTQLDSRRPPQRENWSRRRCRDWLLNFGNPRRRRPYPVQRVSAEILKFLDAVGPPALRYPLQGAPIDDIERVRQVVAGGLAGIAQGQGFAIKASDLNPETSICARPGAGYILGHEQDIFLLAVRDFIASPSGRAIAKCKYKGCPVLIVRRRRQLYCSPKCIRAADAERSRERRKALSPEERYKQRRHRYEDEQRQRLGSGTRIRIDRRGPRPPRPPKPAKPSRARVVQISRQALEVLNQLATLENGASQADLARAFRGREESLAPLLAHLARKSLVTQATDGRWLALARPQSAVAR